MIPIEIAAHAAGQLSALKFYPSEPHARDAIAEEIQRMCPTPEHARYLVKKMFASFNDWPGPREMRAALCNRCRPADGVECGSSVYPDGFPSDRDQGIVFQITGSPLPAIAAPESLPALPEGRVASADPKLDQMVKSAAAAMPRMPSGKFTYDDPVSQKLKDMGFDPPR